jgi:glutathione S-transferase
VLLYDNSHSGNCYKVRLLLAKLGSEYERREVDVLDRTDRPEILGGLNPALRVPTLVLDDGRALAESGAILCYLAEGTEYLPEERFARAKVLQWMFFEQYSHEPQIAVARFQAHAGIEVDPAEAEARQGRGEAALVAMEERLAEHEWIAGERFTVADIALYAYTHVAPEGGFPLDPYPGIRRWIDRVAADPGHIDFDGRGKRRA